MNCAQMYNNLWPLFHAYYPPNYSALTKTTETRNWCKLKLRKRIIKKYIFKLGPMKWRWDSYCGNSNRKINIFHLTLRWVASCMFSLDIRSLSLCVCSNIRLQHNSVIVFLFSIYLRSHSNENHLSHPKMW
jgi:hypothetical protein